MHFEGRFKIGRGLFFAGLCLSLTGLGFADDAGRRVVASGRNPETLVQPPEFLGLSKDSSRAPDTVARADIELSPLQRSDSLLKHAAREARTTRLALGASLMVIGPAVYVAGGVMYTAEVLETLFESGREPNPNGAILMGLGVGGTIFGIVTLFRRWEPEREWRDAQKTSGRVSLNLQPSGRGAALALKF